MDYTNILTALILRDIPNEDAESLAVAIVSISSEKLNEKGLNLVLNVAVKDYKGYGLEETLAALKKWQ